jgi:peptide/nickel transport system substrate-binding protein
MSVPGPARAIAPYAAAMMVAALTLVGAMPAAFAQRLTLVETPMLRAAVEAGKLPPVQQRVPATPLVVKLDSPGREIGKQGGTLNMLIGRSRDVRMLTVYGYARLVGYNRKLDIVPDILQSIEVQKGRVFTLKLRPGHKWSDGQPFTAEDFRYYWEDVANNKQLSPTGPPSDLLVEGQPPRFEVLDPLTVRYTWPKPNPWPRPRGTTPPSGPGRRCTTSSTTCTSSTIRNCPPCSPG